MAKTGRPSPIRCHPARPQGGFMTDLSKTDSLFFANGDLDRDRLEKQVNDALGAAEDGELFLEYRQSESLTWDDGRLRSANFDTAQGFGLRAVADEATAFSHSNELSNDAVARAAETVKAVGSGRSGKVDLGSIGTNISLYSDANPLGEATFEAKVDLLAQIDAYARSRDPRVVQVSASISGNWQAVQIWRAGGQRIGDIRPLVRLTYRLSSNRVTVWKPDHTEKAVVSDMMVSLTKKPGKRPLMSPCVRPSSILIPLPHRPVK
jgi:hypothetical protein